MGNCSPKIPSLLCPLTLKNSTGSRGPTAFFCYLLFNKIYLLLKYLPRTLIQSIGLKWYAHLITIWCLELFTIKALYHLYCIIVLYYYQLIQRIEKILSEDHNPIFAEMKTYITKPGAVESRNSNSATDLKMGQKSVDFPCHLTTWCHVTDLPISKLNAELFKMRIFLTQKCTVLHRFAPIFSQIFMGWYNWTP